MKTQKLTDRKVVNIGAYLKMTIINRLIAVLIICSANILKAQTFVYDGMYFSVVSSEERTVSVIPNPAGIYELPDVVNIPSFVSYNDYSYKVVGIEKEAFSCCTNVLEFNIPNSVVAVSDNSFAYCTSLKNIKISRNVMFISNSAFTGCTSLVSINVDSHNNYLCSKKGVLYDKCLTTMIICPEGKSSVSLPSSTMKINGYTFYASHKGYKLVRK